MHIRIIASLFIALLSPRAQATLPDPLEFEPSVPAPIRELIRGDLAWMKGVRGEETSSELHFRIFGSGTVDGQAYLSYFLRQVSRIDYSETLPSFALAAAGLDGSIIVAPHWNDSRFSRIYRLSSLLHEARHNETGFEHVLCPTPFLKSDGTPWLSSLTGQPLADSPSCDDRPDGAYGIAYLFLKNMGLHCTSCSLEEKRDATHWAGEILARIIDPRSNDLLASDGAEPTQPEPAIP